MSFLRVCCRIECPSDPGMEPKYSFLEAIFQQQCQNGKVCLDCAGVDGMHMSPSRGALRGIQNSKKSELRTKRAWKAQGCTENTRKTTPIEVKMGAKAATFLWSFLPGWPHARPQGRRDLKNLLLVRRITKMWPPELQKWAQEYPKWNLNLKSEPKSWWGAFL